MCILHKNAIHNLCTVHISQLILVEGSLKTTYYQTYQSKQIKNPAHTFRINIAQSIDENVFSCYNNFNKNHKKGTVQCS